MKFIVYIAQMKDGRLYIGHTTDKELQAIRHRKGKGGRTTQIWGFRKIIYTEEHATRVAAIHRERQLKRWTRAKKLALARGNFPALKQLARSSTAKAKQARN